MQRAGTAKETMQLVRDESGAARRLPKDRRFSLVVLDGKNAGDEFPIEGLSITIGRDAAVSDLVLADQGASRAHACLEFAKGKFTIEDLQSRNGLTVNQRPVTRAVLEHGDKITIGTTSLQYLAESSGYGGKIYELPDRS